MLECFLKNGCYSACVRYFLKIMPFFHLAPIIGVAALSAFLMSLPTKAMGLPLACAQCDAKGVSHIEDKAEHRPRISCDEAIFDFGSKDSSETLEHTFILKNIGTADLAISKIQPACGCTTAALEKTNLVPGESTNVKATLSLAGRSGEIEKPIVIESNDPDNPILKLAFKGTVGAVYEISPSSMILRKPSPASPADASAVVKSAKDVPFEILESRSESGKLKVQWVKFPDQNAYQVSAKIEDSLLPGQFSDKIILKTNHPVRQEVDISVLVTVPAPIAVAPTRIVLSEDSPTPISRTIILKSPAGEKLTIDKIETPDEAMTTKSEPMGDFGFRISIGNIQPNASLMGKFVKIYLASGDVVQIPFEIKAKN